VATTLLVALIVGLIARKDGDGDRAAPADRQHESTSTSADRVTTTTSDQTDAGGPTASTLGSAGPAGIGDGTWRVPEQLRPGRYLATDLEDRDCGWARLADAQGRTVIAADNRVRGQAIVDILGSDAAFHSKGCGTWQPYAAPESPPATTIDDGDWVAGEQIEAGPYLAPRVRGCTWMRANGFTHTPTEVTQTERTNIALEGPFYVTLIAGERFSTRACAPWKRAN
jgi:hypothetical protein